MKGSIGRPTILKRAPLGISYRPNSPCPSCNCVDDSLGGILVTRGGKFGRFLGCSRYPDCKYTTTRIKGVKDIQEIKSKREKKKAKKKLEFRVDRLERLVMKLLKDNNMWQQ